MILGIYDRLGGKGDRMSDSTCGDALSRGMHAGIRVLDQMARKFMKNLWVMIVTVLVAGSSWAEEVAVDVDLGRWVAYKQENPGNGCKVSLEADRFGFDDNEFSENRSYRKDGMARSADLSISCDFDFEVEAVELELSALLTGNTHRYPWENEIYDSTAAYKLGEYFKEFDVLRNGQTINEKRKDLVFWKAVARDCHFMPAGGPTRPGFVYRDCKMISYSLYYVDRSD